MQILPKPPKVTAAERIPLLLLEQSLVLADRKRMERSSIVACLITRIVVTSVQRQSVVAARDAR